MKSLLRRFVYLSLLSAVALSVASRVRALKWEPSAAPLRPADGTARAKVNEAYGKLPLSFEANRGQADGQIKFLSRGGNYSFLFAVTEATLQLGDGGDSTGQPATVRMKFVGANSQARIEGLDELPGKSNYLIGADQSRWRTNIPNYARARYDEVWPGIDVVFYGNERQLEYDFVVAPGANPRTIRLSFAGAKKISVDASGDLILRLGEGELRQRKPVVYQEVNGARRNIEGGYVINREGEVGFKVADYDLSRPLVIDPIIAYSTFLGGGGDEIANGIAVDQAGNAYITGTTNSTNFPKAGALQGSLSGNSNDAFIVKLNAAGSAIVYATYFGGAGQDQGAGIAVDSGGAAYVIGQTNSMDFPLANALQSALRGPTDAFIAKLSADGSALVYSTYLGGGGNDQANAIAVDGADNAHITGSTNSVDFPTANPLQATLRGRDDAFVAKLNADGSALLFATYLGGGDGDLGNGVAVDAGGGIYVTGQTAAGPGGANDFPVTPGAIQRTPGGVFVTKLDVTNRSLSYSTYLGGFNDAGRAIAVDAIGAAYVTGYTFGSFPVTPGALQTNFGGKLFDSRPATDAFITKINPAGSALVYSTYYGGQGNESGNGIAVNAAGNAVVTGETEYQFQLPAKCSYQGNAIACPTAFILELNTSGARTQHGIQYAVGDPKAGRSVAIDYAGAVYFAGSTMSGEGLVITPGAFQPAFAGRTDAFITKIRADVVNVSAASYFDGEQAGEAIAAAFGINLAFAAQSVPSIPLPTLLDGTTVRIRDSAGAERLAPLYFVSLSQINYQIPSGVSPGPATVVVTNKFGDAYVGGLRIAKVAPGVFAANGNGQGVAAAVVQRVKADGSQAYETISRFDQSLRQFVSVPIDLGPESDQIFLALFGTGWRFRSSEAAVKVTVGGVDAPVTYAGLQPTLVGVDQINARLPRTLAGKGEVELVVTVDGKTANIVRVSFK